EARRDARRLRRGKRVADDRDRMLPQLGLGVGSGKLGVDSIHDNISSRACRTAAIASSSEPAWRASLAIRSAADIGAATGLRPSRPGSVIIPAPHVNCVAGSIRMKLPVPRLSV